MSVLDKTFRIRTMVTSQEADRTGSIFCFSSFQGERGEHGPPGKGERGEPGPAGPKVRLDLVPGPFIWIYGLFKSSFNLKFLHCPRRGQRGRPGCLVLKGQRSALFSLKKISRSFILIFHSHRIHPEFVFAFTSGRTRR